MVAPEREIPSGEGEESQRTLLLAHEDVSTTVTRVVEIDIPQDPEVMLPPEDWALVKDYLSLLLNESNLPHFVGIVKRSKQKDTEGRDIEVFLRIFYFDIYFLPQVFQSKFHAVLQKDP